MKPHGLHWTAHVSQGPDYQNKQQWFHMTNILTADCWYWQEHISFLLVPLTSSLLELCDVPHISFSKQIHMQWHDVADVPNNLWASHKYIKNCDPAVITPKSDYGPCQQQYPLKVEAIEGIRPVFDPLLKIGVIVPCDNSPVCTPIFSERDQRTRITHKLEVCTGLAGSKCCSPAASTTCPKS